VCELSVHRLRAGDVVLVFSLGGPATPLRYAQDDGWGVLCADDGMGVARRMPGGVFGPDGEEVFGPDGEETFKWDVGGVLRVG